VRSAAENFNGASVAPINSEERRNFSDGNGATDGASEAVAEPVAWAFLGKPVLRLAVLSAGRKSGAGAGGFYATGEHTSAVESRPARNWNQ